RARRDQPPYDSSAMDGWAVRAADLVEGEPLAVQGESAAGHPFEAPLAPSAAVRVFTGAALPAGTDQVVIQEEAQREGDRVRLQPAPGSSRHVRPKGGDFRAGDVLLPAGVRIDPWRLMLAASAGHGELLVAPSPRVAILSTGEEIVPAGAEAGPHQIFESNGPALAARARAWGAEPRRLHPAGDDEAAIAAAVADVDCDLVVTVGGASVGDHDLVKPALTRLGLEPTVGSVAVRPGKPTWFGRLADGRRVLGLPGNPASALVCAELFLRPLLLTWQGADPAFPLAPVRLAAPLGATGPREHWMRARLSLDADGGRTARVFPDQDSSLVAVFAAADALIRRPAGAPAMPAGALVEALALDRL
ncbi:MAG: molybdopterin molybdotransferase MoeA, partial [Caulobacteraceae bacterium]|nr:molybdopterin molybdotransferase MoeA [Caulobacter sp.]